jgi:hypothetical protein
LFRCDSPQADSLKRKPDSGTRQHELAKLQDRVLPPALKEQNAAAKQGNRRKENIVITSKPRTEGSQKI